VYPASHFTFSLLAFHTFYKTTLPSSMMLASENGCLSSLTTWKPQPTTPLVSEKSTFLFYPNPTTGSFTLEFTGRDLPEVNSVQICDIRGQKVLDIHLNGMNKQVITLANQPRGMYFIRVLGEKQAETAKILKQ
jgi:hypothetical protein